MIWGIEAVILILAKSGSALGNDGIIEPSESVGGAKTVERTEIVPSWVLFAKGCHALYWNQFSQPFNLSQGIPVGSSPWIVEDREQRH